MIVAQPRVSVEASMIRLTAVNRMMEEGLTHQRLRQGILIVWSG
jgi:hypothetical protein